MLGDIGWLWPTMALSTQELSHLLQTLQSNSDLRSPSKCSTEAERELALYPESLNIATDFQFAQRGFFFNK